MPNPSAAMLVIGDEILSGRTQDTNTNHLAQALTSQGIDLKEVRVVPDEQAAIVDAVNDLRARFDHVFTSGGIGPTHDDITADAIAAAFGVPIYVRDDARAAMQAFYDTIGGTLTPSRLRMARIPQGARLIDNEVSGAPGFTIGNVHVLAGVPSVFKAMVAALLPTIAGGAPVQSRALRVERGESDIAEELAGLAADFPDLSVGSYPFRQEGIFGTNIVVRGQDGVRVDEAFARLSELFSENNP